MGSDHTLTRPTALFVTGTVLLLWVLTLPGLWLATYQAGGPAPVVSAFLLPWGIGVGVLGVLYFVQRG